MSTADVAVVMPESQEGTESVVGSWLKKLGDRVAEHEPLVEISTDKVMVEIAAPCAGVLSEILKNANEPVTPGEVLARIAAGESRPVAPASTEAAAQQTATMPAAKAAGQGNAELSPAVKKLLKEHHLEAHQITGTGAGGRITHDDVMNFVRSGAAPAGAGSNKVPHSPMRRSIAQHMAQSMVTAPHVTAVYEADLSALFAHHAAEKPRCERQGVKLTLSAYFVRAAALALQKVPEVNSRWHDDALELFTNTHIGLATALDGGGLIVPVVRGAEQLSLLETARKIQDLTARARTGELTPEEVRGGTFTISNHGVSGTLFAAPIIINQPQSAILGIGKVEDRVTVVRQGSEVTFVARPKCYVTLTIDHRALDGFHANRFLTEFVSALSGGAFE